MGKSVRKEHGKDWQKKAYCGDAIAQLAVGELLWNYKDFGGLLSNKAMTFAWCDYNNMRIKDFDLNTKKLKHYKKGGTLFEILLYDTYKKEGYEKAKDIVKQFLIPQKGREELSYM